MAANGASTPAKNKRKTEVAMGPWQGMGAPELTGAMKKAQAKGFMAIANQDEAMLEQAGKEWAPWATQPWAEQKRGLSTLALPAAARAGWAHGIKALCALGADVNAPDACRQGMGKGRAPLAEAVSRQSWDAAQALIDCGASLDARADLMWACAFVAWRQGPGEGAKAMRWIKARGLDLPQASWPSSQADYLFAGGVKTGDPQAREEWARELFEGLDDSKESRARMWHFAFGAASASREIPQWLASRWAQIDPDAGRWMLQWGLEYGCPEMSEWGARALEQAGKPWVGLDCLGKACAREVGLGELAFSDEKSAKDCAVAFERAWERLGESWAQRPERLQEMAKKAMYCDNAGLLDGLLRHGASAAQALEGPLRGDRRYGSGRASKGKETVSAWLAGRLREGADPDSLRDDFDDLRRSEWLDRQAQFDACLAKAQSLELEACAAQAPARAWARL